MGLMFSLDLSGLHILLEVTSVDNEREGAASRPSAARRVRSGFRSRSRQPVCRRGASAVLALEMLCQQLRLDRLEIRRQLQGHQGHVGDAFDGDGRAPRPP